MDNTIDIDIIVGEGNASSVHTEVPKSHIITDEDCALFGITENKLKEMYKAKNGKKPNDVFLHYPLPWDDVSFQQTSMAITAEAVILETNVKPIIVKEHVFENNSSTKGTFSAEISESVTNSLSSTWKEGGEISFAQKITVKGTFLGAGAESETSMGFTQSWGQEETKSESMTIGSASKVSVDLDPGEKVVAELLSNRGIMKVEVTYRASLLGMCLANYNPRYEGAHFHRDHIGVMMNHYSGLEYPLIAKEIIDIDYYSGSKVELKDAKTKELLSTMELA